MLPSLKCQVFCFGSKFASFAQLSRQQTQFSKLSLCQFLVYMAKYPHTKSWKKSTVDPDKNVTDRRRYRQVERWTRLIL